LENKPYTFEPFIRYIDYLILLKIENILEASLKKLNLSIESKLIHSTNKELAINGVDLQQWAIFHKEVFSKSENSFFHKNIFVFSTNNEAESYYNQIKKTEHCFFFPDLGCDIYSSMLPSEFNLVKRISIINSILSNPDQYSIVCTIESLTLFLPPPSFFEGNDFKIEVSDIIAPNELSKKLVEIGYVNTPTAEEPGSFSIKGEIFDIYPLESKPVRLTYFDDMIEEICEIDLATLRSIKANPIEKLIIGGTQYSFLKKENLTNFRSQFPRPKLNDTEKFKYREHVLKKLSSQSFFDDYPLFTSYFFTEKTTLIDYIVGAQFYFFNKENCLTDYQELKDNLVENSKSYHSYSDDIKPDPINIFDYNFSIPKNSKYINQVDYTVDLENDFESRLNLNISPVRNFEKSDQSKTRSTKLIDAINFYHEKRADIRIYFTSMSSKAEMEYLISNFAKEASNSVIYHNESLKNGFYYETENILFLSESDFFHSKTKKTISRNTNIDKDVFAEQISTLKINDHVIHGFWSWSIFRYRNPRSFRLYF